MILAGICNIIGSWVKYGSGVFEDPHTKYWVALGGQLVRMNEKERKRKKKRERKEKKKRERKRKKRKRKKKKKKRRR